jgi:MFS family permease
LSWTSPHADTDAYVEANLRRNFLALAMDFGFFGLGMSISSTSTLLPALAARLGAPNLLLGAIPFVVLLGRSLPAVFSARLIEPLPRKLPFVLTYTVWERLPWLVLAMALLMLGQSNPDLVLALLVVTLLAVAMVGGALSPAWTELVARVISTNYRGRLFALGGAFSTGLGLLGAVLSGFLLREYPFPTGYALCLGATFLCLVASYAVMVTVREPAMGASRPRLGLGSHLARLPRILRSNRTFGWYLVAQGLRMIGMMATGFYAVYALRHLGAEEWHVGGFTFAMLAAQSVGGVGLGFLADHAGHRVSLVVGSIASAAASGIALATSNLLLYHMVFVMMGLAAASYNVSSQNLVLELAPHEERPTYLGLASSSQAPFLLVAPLLAGALVDRNGFGSLFLFAGVLSLVSAAIYALRVEEPRRNSLMR